MTAIETWITEHVALLVRDMRAEISGYAGYLLCSGDNPHCCLLADDGTIEEQRECACFRSTVPKAVMQHVGWDDLERRAAILLLQARAKEARQIEASMSISTLAMVAKVLGLHDQASLVLAKQVLQVVAGACRNRSTDLEALGMQMARPEGWPIRERTVLVRP